MEVSGIKYKFLRNDTIEKDMHVSVLEQILPVEIQEPLFSEIHCALGVVLSFQKLTLSSNISSTLQGPTI